MQRSTKWLLVLFATGFHSPLVSAQQIRGLEVGTRVRLSAPVVRDGREVPQSGPWVIGTVRHTDNERVELKLAKEGEESSYVVPVSNIKRLEVSRGALSPRQGTRRGALLGSLIGGGVGAGYTGFYLLLKKFHGDECKNISRFDTPCDEREGEASNFGFFPGEPSVANAAKVTLSGTLLGAGAGALFGSRTRERWQALPLSSFAFQVDRKRTTVAVSIGR